MDEVAKRATPSRPDLRERVRAWLAQGRLPAIDATAWAGPGTGERCAVCRGVVETGQTEYATARRCSRTGTATRSGETSPARCLAAAGAS